MGLGCIEVTAVTPVNVLLKKYTPHHLILDAPILLTGLPWILYILAHWLNPFPRPQIESRLIHIALAQYGLIKCQWVLQV